MSIRNNRKPRYHPSNVRFESFGINTKNNELGKYFVVGQKFEFLNPFLLLSKTLKCATIVHICETDGYVMVAQDDDKNYDEIPISIYRTSCLYPLGFAEKYGLQVESSLFKGMPFNWPEYLEKTNARLSVSMDMLISDPIPEKAKKFKVGGLLDVFFDNQKILPASIASVHGTVVKKNYEGWDQGNGTLHDTDSTELFLRPLQQQPIVLLSI
uniref:Couple_hipA domain-containing protein n=1 Tax=Caenorhabditis tropicalis TaxID=1561998 RepID=A0A1I7T356_9PELO